MKPARLVLVYDRAWELPWLRLVLSTRGYRVYTCTRPDEVIATLKERPVDLVMVGSDLSYPQCLLGMPTLQRRTGESNATLFERVRISLVRKRGPKKPAAFATWQQSAEKELRRA